MSMGRHTTWLLACVALACAAAAQADELAATPYRPSVGTPAALSAPGYFEIEAGVAVETGSGTRTTSIPALLKYAFTPRVGVSFGFTPWLRIRSAAGHQSGHGDGSLTLKLAQPLSDDFMLGGELTSSLALASSGLGSEHADRTLNLIGSGDVAGLHIDLNLNRTRLGDAQASGVSRGLTGWSLGASRALTPQWGLGLEVSGTRQSGSNSTRQWLASAGLSLSPLLVLDAFVARSASGSERGHTFGLGFTRLLAN